MLHICNSGDLNHAAVLKTFNGDGAAEVAD
jgi:hypothetical protein